MILALKNLQFAIKWRNQSNPNQTTSCQMKAVFTIKIIKQTSWLITNFRSRIIKWLLRPAHIIQGKYKNDLNFIHYQWDPPVEYLFFWILVCLFHPGLYLHTLPQITCFTVRTRWQRKFINFSFLWRCPWCNGYRRRNWTRRYEFKS